MYFIRSLVFGLLVATIWACGDDNAAGPRGLGGTFSPVSFQDGTWSITNTMITSGTDSTCNDPDTLVLEEQQVLCNATSEDIEEFQSFGAGNNFCFVEGDGDDFTFSCDISLSQDPCTIHYSIWGSGAATPTSYDVTMNVLISATGPDSACGFFDVPCTTQMNLSGVWVSGIGACP